MTDTDSKIKDRLPPGQTLTKRFPVTGESHASEVLTKKNWRLHVDGKVEEARSFSFKDILALPQEDLQMDIHCVTSWSRYDMTFAGVRFKHLLDLGVSPSAKARFVRFTAYSDRNHDTSLPIKVALEEAWLIHHADGKPLAPEHGFPMRIVLPGRYFYKSLKWLHRINFLEEDQLGFWERASGYHNVGDPWREERFDGARFTSKQDTDAFKALSSYRDYQNDESVIVKANLAHWQPKTLDLQRLQLKACDFRHAQLSKANFRHANLTLGKFQGADLEGADFTGADLEGADFSGAYLADTRFSDNYLSATTFERKGTGLASYQGMEVVRPEGLLESQEAYLHSIGVITEIK